MQHYFSEYCGDICTPMMVNQSCSYQFSNAYTFPLQAVDTNYTITAAKAGPSQVVMFEGDEIMLDIAVEGIVLENGWTINPYTHPGVSLTIYKKLNPLTEWIYILSNRSPRIRLTTSFRAVNYLPASCM